jgi:deoxyribose-phosphate aldolase
MTAPTRKPRFTPPSGPRAAAPAPPPVGLERNPGIPLDLAWVRDIRINRSAVERRAATLVTRRTVKLDWQVAWLR